MGIEETIRNRRSIREYLPEPVPVETVIEILDTARWAPTAGDRQEYYFIIVDDKALISKIVDSGGSKLLLASDKVVFVLYSSLTDNLEYADHIQSASAIIQNFTLLAHEKKIGTCWVCHLPRKKELKKLLKIPANIEVIGCIALGRADFDKVKPVERKCDIRDIVGLNIFFSKRKLPDNKRRTCARIILSKIYYALPTFLKKCLSGTVDKYFVKKFEN